MSIIHGVFLLVATYYYVFHVDYEYNNANTHYESWVTSISLSYFIHDMVMMIILGLLDGAMTIHHGVCIFGYAYMIYVGYGGPVEVTGMWFAELSNPAMHGRIITKHLGLRYTNLYDAMEYIYISLYMYSRLYGALVMVAQSWLYCPNVPFIVNMCGSALVVQSIFFSFRMISILKSKYKEAKERKAKGIYQYWFSENPSLMKLAYMQKKAKHSKEIVP